MPSSRSSDQIYLVDGMMDFSGGVDSGKVALVQSPSNPNGIRRDQLAWLRNGSVRGGGITQRSGWKYLTTIANGDAPYQGGWLYLPRIGDSYLVVSIGGTIYRVPCVAGATPINLSADFGLTNNPNTDQSFFVQGEEFLVIQSGDYVTNPLFWNGSILNISLGLNVNVPANSTLPPAGPMTYYQGRIWYAQGDRTVAAGDIVGGTFGNPLFKHRDSILYVTENPLATQGDGFTIPAASGPIRALAWSAAIDATLGQAELFIFTRTSVFTLSVPTTRADWITAVQPMMKVIQNKYGTPAERSVVRVNSDLFYVSSEPAFRSLALAVRYFNQWANVSVSRNMNRLVPFQDRALLRFSSSILWNNRIYFTCLPFDTGTVGVAHGALAALDFDPISTFQDELQSVPVPAWEGIQDGLNALQLFEGDFGGLDRAFATVVSATDSSIQLWELTSGDRFENGDGRVSWTLETPSLDFRDAMQFKELQGGFLWFDRWYGKVDVLVEYRSDDSPCYAYWADFSKCYARNSCEDVANPVCYPLTPYGEGNEKPLSLPHPNPKECAPNSVRPMMLGYSFQLRITMLGFARFRGYRLFASRKDISIYSNSIC